MTIKEDTIVKPLPSDQKIAKYEDFWRVTFPKDFKTFIKKYNGVEPNEMSFVCNNHSYALIHFLCLLDNIKDNPYSCYDIDVVTSYVCDRLTDDKDDYGVKLVPIGDLFAGNLLCLDFRENLESPSICVWNHEESGDFEPVTYKVADSFTEFTTMLTKETYENIFEKKNELSMKATIVNLEYRSTLEKLINDFDNEIAFENTRAKGKLSITDRINEASIKSKVLNQTITDICKNKSKELGSEIL